MKSSALASALVAVSLGLVISLGVVAWLPIDVARAGDCEYWVSTTGDDANAGTSASPWASLTHASEAVPDQGCVVLFAPGIYSGSQDLGRRFTSTTTFRSSVPYAAVFESNSTVVDFGGVANVVLEGFEIRHAGPGASGYLVIADRKADGDIWSENITIRNNVIHDSYDNDLLKLHNGVRFATVEGNVFYNQGPSEQQLDINSVTDIVIRGNIFFNDFGASGRLNSSDTKHFIVVKDSNEGDDGLLGSERVTIEGNVFSGWQGGNESLIQAGNDGKPYHEVKELRIVDNLILGAGPDSANTVLGIAGADGVVFANNTVSGDFPSHSAAFRITVKGSNPQNRNVSFHNNIWSDPTGTMGAQPSESGGDFSAGDASSVSGLFLRTNLYWNGGVELPTGGVLSPSDDPNPIVGDPGLPLPVRSEITPVWDGARFRGADVTIGGVFLRIVTQFGIPASNIVENGDPNFATSDDILGVPRDSTPTLGAVEITSTGLDTAACPADVIPGGTFVDMGGFSRETMDAVDCLLFHDITTGVSPGVFDPSSAVPRWQMALFLIRALDAAEVVLPDGSDQGFGDLSGLSAEAVSAVNRLAQLDVTTGVSSGVFDPSSPVPRWQMALFLVRWLDAAGVST